MKKYILTIFILFLIIMPNIIEAQIPLNLDGYPEFGGITPSTGMNFSEFAVWLYYGIITIATAAAFGIIVWGGMEYITSAGNDSKMTSGREKIQAAVVGLVIILISYLVLETINPQLLEMRDLKIQ